jgi:hypothetical protein
MKLLVTHKSVFEQGEVKGTMILFISVAVTVEVNLSNSPVTI